MKNRYIPAFIMLAAGLVCCVLCVVQRWPVLNSYCFTSFLYHWADCGADCWKSAGRASGYD